MVDPAYSDQDPALAVALAKADRAVEHFNTLKARIGAFLDEKPYRLAIELEAHTGWHVAQMWVVKEPPPALCVIVGEIAYQQISALNLLTFELAQRHLRREPTKKEARLIQFPIALSAADFRGWQVLKFVSAHTAAVFEELQPYRGFHGPKGPGQHVLPLLKEITDSDKHQDLVASFAYVSFEGIAFEWDTDAASDPLFEQLVSQDDSLEEGTPIARIRFKVGNDQAKVRVDRELAADVRFLTRNWAIDLGDLENSIGWMSDALRDLSGALAMAKLNPA